MSQIHKWTVPSQTTQKRTFHLAVFNDNFFRITYYFIRIFYIKLGADNRGAFKKRPHCLKLPGSLFMKRSILIKNEVQSMRCSQVLFKKSSIMA